MTRTSVRALAAALLLLALWGCQGSAPETGSAERPGQAERPDSAALPDGTASADTAAVPDTRPPTLRETISIEGQSEPITLRRFDEPGVPFVTYLPANEFAADRMRGDEGTGVRFYANFGGVANPNAYLSFFFPADGARLGTVAALRAFAEGSRSLLANPHWVVEAVDTTRSTGFCPWADVAYDYRDTAQDAYGYLCIGQSGGRPFYLLTHVPLEYGDGFGPRAEVILKHLRWRATGRGLGG